eukprot:scpid62702/ scgid2306/ TGF-beta receptor type-1; TGF-beta type I receptor; Transforming growth factor-beta receptor type I
MAVTYAPLSTTDGIVQATVAPAPATTPLLVGIAILSFSIIPITASVYRLAFKFACGPRCAVSAKVCAPHADDEANGHQLADENETDRDTLTFLTSPRRLPGRITVHGKYAEGALAGFRFCTWRDARSSSDVSTAAVMKTFNEGLLHAKDWLHEILMYNMYHLEHPAVLRMLEAGLQGTGDVGNRMWTIFERCTHGNLRDLLLRSGCVQTQDMLRILHSIASGLHYLHSSSPLGTNSTGEFKPSIAHCHLATYNVFVRRDGSACIGNLCSSVPKSSHGTKSQVGGVAKTTATYFIPVVGSPRYASPEMLSMWVDAYEDFDILLASDIYSFSLIMWEILVMCPVGPGPSRYTQAYSSLVEDCPSMNEMRDLVVGGQQRPSLHDAWMAAEHYKTAVAIMVSSWNSTWACRPSSGKVLRSLNDLLSAAAVTQNGERCDDAVSTTPVAGSLDVCDTATLSSCVTQQSV